MRLTLRTLLAYLDDTLDPAQTKAIGQQVSESAAAQELIARLKEVVRRRRLATPPTTGSDAKLDANTVAEYIDSVLPPDRLTEVEELCLQDDMYLAEVAACHQILTVVLSEPALVPPTAKRRMYSLIKGRESIPSRRAQTASHSDYHLAETSGEGHHEDDEALLLGLPLYLRQGSLLRRLAPIAGVLVLLIAVVGVVWYLISTDEEPVRRKRREDSQIARNEDDKNKVPDQAKVEDKGKEVPEVKPETKAEARPPEAKSEPKAETNTTTAAPAKPPETPVEIKPETVALPTTPSTVRRAAGKALAGKGEPAVLLQRASEKEGWQRIPPEGPVNSNDALLSLPGYKSEVALPSGVRLVLWGNLPEGPFAFTLESAVVLHDAPPGELDADLTLDHGRIAIVNDKPDGVARVRIRFNQNKEIWDLNLLESGATVGMELWGRYTEDVKFKKEGEGRAAEAGGERLEGPMMVAGIFMIKGQANLKVRYDTWLLREAPGRNFYAWNNVGPAASQPDALAAVQMPGWTRPTPPEPPKELKDLRGALADLDKRLTQTPRVDEALADAIRVKEPKATVRVLAVFALGAIGDLSSLLDALANEQHADVRQAAVGALKHWIGLKPENDMAVYRDLNDKFKSASAEIIMSLLHGFQSDADRLDPQTYDTLIHYLENDKLPIREMALAQLTTLVPEGAQKIPFNPAGAADQHKQAFRRWKELIPDGALPPNLRNLQQQSPANRPNP